MRKPIRGRFRFISFVFLAFALIAPIMGDAMTSGIRGAAPVALAQPDTQPDLTSQDDGSPPPDADGDGIPDDQDECPTDPTNSCNLPPDTDGDGIPDDQDTCPNDPSNACNLPADTDGDGIPDDQDPCPTDPANGCNLPPDADGDGIPDDQDPCPEDPMNSCVTKTPSAAETQTATETPTPTETPATPVEAASAAIPPAPWQLVRLPFDGTYDISQGPQASSCRSLGLSHIQGDSNKANERAIDIAVPNRTPIYAAGDGVVQFEGWEYGVILIRLQHPGGLVTWYAHLSQTVIDTGWSVSAGQLIGYSGDTGASGAYHLHFAATQGASYGSASVDLRGMPGFSWNRNIIWNDEGFVSNCAALNNQADGKATGSAPPPPVPPTATRVPPTATRVPPTVTLVPTMPGRISNGSQVRTTANVNMRSAAGTGYGVLHTIGSGTRCSVLSGPTAANGYQWYRLDCGSSRVGWVAGSYLSPISSSPATSTKAPTNASGSFPTGSAVHTTTKVNMRSGAGTGYQVQTVVASGTQCTVQAGPTAANGYQWYRLDCGSSRVGWVAGSYLKSNSSSAATPTKTPTKLAGGFATGSTVLTTTGSLRMRKGAGTGYGVLYTLGSGTQCTVLGGPTAANGYQWYQLNCGSSRIGWIAGSYLKQA